MWLHCLKRLQCILVGIHQYRVRIIYVSGLDLFIADWLTRQNHKENKDEEVQGMNININAIHMITDISKCMTAQEIQHGTAEVDHLQQLTTCVIRGWSENRNKIPQEKEKKHTGHSEMKW